MHKVDEDATEVVLYFMGRPVGTSPDVKPGEDWLRAKRPIRINGFPIRCPIAYFVDPSHTSH